MDASSGVEKHLSVHVEGLAGDEAGVVAGEEQPRRCGIQRHSLSMQSRQKRINVLDALFIVRDA